MDSIDVVAVGFNILNYGVVVPLILYCLYLYNKYANVAFMEYRNKWLVFHINVHVTIVAMMFTFISLTRVWKVLDLPDWTTELCVGYGIDGLFTLLTIKTYLLYFQEHYNLSALEDLFEKQHTSGTNQTLSWFVLNRRRWGSLRYLFTRVFLPYTTFSATINCLSANYLGQGLCYDFIHLGVSSLTQVPCLYLYFKVRHIKDPYKIAQEIFYSIAAMVILLTIFMCTFLSLRLVAFVSTAHTVASLTRLEWLLIAFIVGALGASLAVITTAYPVWHYLRLAAADSIETSSPSASSAQTDAILSMLKIIADPKMFKSFSEFLVTEFCVENLGFLVELVQIKYAFQVQHNNIVRIAKQTDVAAKSENEMISIGIPTHIDDTAITPNQSIVNLASLISLSINEEDEMYITLDLNAVHEKVKNPFTYFVSDNIIYGMRLPFNLTSSSILTEFESVDQRFVALFEKYIKTGSPHELNLPFEQSNTLRTCFNKLIADKQGVVDLNERTERDLFSVFDDCAVEILALLQDSFNRFQAVYVTHTHSEL